MEGGPGVGQDGGGWVSGIYPGTDGNAVRGDGARCGLDNRADAAMHVDDDGGTVCRKVVAIAAVRRGDRIGAGRQIGDEQTDGVTAGRQCLGSGELAAVHIERDRAGRDVVGIAGHRCGEGFVFAFENGRFAGRQRDGGSRLDRRQSHISAGSADVADLPLLRANGGDGPFGQIIEYAVDGIAGIVGDQGDHIAGRGTKR